MINFTQILFDQTKRRPEALAVRHPSVDLNYVAGTAAAMSYAGLKAHEVVALRLDDALDHLTATLAVAHLGATVVSVPDKMPDAQRERLLRRVSCKWVVDGEAYGPTHDASHFPEMRWSDIKACSADHQIAPVKMEPDRPWIYVNGSGSTGRPKIMAITHVGNVICAVVMVTIIQQPPEPPQAFPEKS